MRKLLLLAISAAAFTGAFYLAEQPDSKHVKIRIRLVDAGDVGKYLGGMVRVLDAEKKHVPLPELFDRMTGLTKDNPGVHWFLIREGGEETTLPRGKYRIEAVSGLESGLVAQDLDLRDNAPAEVKLELPLIFQAEKSKLVAGNTHLHLKNFSQATSDEYLRKIPVIDGLRVMFVSYLERDKDDLTYITNKHPIGAMPKFSNEHILFDNGEEHRHNFQGFGQGYGHVMFLNIKELVKPVSIGPGIMNAGFDDLPLRAGIDNARKQGGTVIWCHNTNGYEDVPSAVTGRLDALNFFDGSRGGTYEDHYYKYLNIGIRLPISTGTDWFMYDFARVYAEVTGKLTIASWLDAVKAGRCQATNGPLLSLKVDGQSIGAVLDVKEPRTLKVEASAMGRHPAQKLQLIRNGVVIKQVANETGRIELAHEVRIDEPAWFAVRIESAAKNEFDRQLFAHTSPIYVKYQGKGVFQAEAAIDLLKQIEEGRSVIKMRGRFSSDEASRKLLGVYDEADQLLRARINARK